MIIMNLENKFIELLEYNPKLTKKKDFQAFWENTLEISQNVPLRGKRKKTNYPSSYVTVYDISYCGFDDTRISGWFIVPKFTGTEKLPCIITYPGFGSGRKTPMDYMHWISMGVCVLAVDVRLHGGDSGSDVTYTTGFTQNVTTLGILDKECYYYRAVYADAIKAIDFACSMKEVNSKKIIVHGMSQGGGIAMAVCALDKRPKLGLFNVPSHSDLETRVIQGSGAYRAVQDYLKQYPLRINQVFDTLSYFDIMNMAEQITCEVLASVALNDDVCPATCFFASYNQINSMKQVEIYPFNGHDGAYSLHLEKELTYIKNSGLLD